MTAVERSELDPSPGQEPSPVMAFLAHQVDRFRLRWLSIGKGIASALFWTLALILHSWLTYYGLAAVGYALLAAWFVLALPALFYQLALIVDVVSYALLGKISFYPNVILRIAEQPMPIATTPRERFVFFMSAFTSVTSPLSALSTWALIVLFRAPPSTHLQVGEPRRVIQLQRKTERRIFADILDHVHIR
jgi:hypothetical protein